MSSAPQNAWLFASASAAPPTPVTAGQVAVLSGVVGSWTSIQSLPAAAPLPYGFGSSGQSYGSEGSDQNWHFISPTALTVSTTALSVSSSPYVLGSDIYAVGGAAPYLWEFIGGTLGGLSLSSQGVLSGFAKPGTYNFSVSVSDSNNNRATGTIALTVT
jgi:Putative Ig domain